MTRNIFTAMVFLALVVPATAQETPSWSVAFNLGTDVALTGNVHDSGSGSVLALPTTVESRTYDNIYGKPLTWSADLGYMVSPTGEVRARVFRTSGEAERIQVGNVATLPLFAKFDSYTTLGVDVGDRQYLTRNDSPIIPFAGASVGLLNVDKIRSTFSVPAASVVLSDVSMYDSTMALSFAVSAGVMIPFGSNFGIQGGIDFRWHGDLNPVDGLAGSGLEPINDKSRRWSMPVTVGAVVRF